MKVLGVAGISKFSRRLIRVHTATKSFERFLQPKSVDNEVPKSTAYKTKLSCKVFEEWKQNWLVKSRTLETGGLFTTKDFEEGVQTLDTAITDMSACSLNYWLSKFVQEASNSLAGSAILPVRCTQFFADWSAPFWCKRKCCIELIGHVRPKVSYTF